MKTDVIVIGSGLGGLVCARLLAGRGRRVTVLERHSTPGGCLQSYRRRGVSFDTGLHYVGGLAEGHRLHRVFDSLGLMDLPWQRMDPDGFDLITIAGETFPLAEGYQHFADRLADRFPRERDALRRYAALLERADRLPPGDAEVQRLCAVGAYDYLQETFSDPLLVNVLAGNALKSDLQRETMPLFNFLHATSAFVGGGAWRLQGCGDDLVAVLCRGIEDLGGTVVTGAEVSELVETDGRITVARCTNGETYEADTFISDIHPQQTFALVKESTKLSRLFRRRIDMLGNSLGMFTVSMVTDGDIPYFNHNKYIYRQANVWETGPTNPTDPTNPTGPTPDPSPEGRGASGGWSVDRVLVSCMSKPALPGEAAGGLVVDLLTPVPLSLFEPWADSRVGRRPDGYQQLKEQLAGECIALAATQIPDLLKVGLGSLPHQEEVGGMGSQHRLPSPSGGGVGGGGFYTSSPLTWRDYTLTPLGSAFGLRKDWRQPLLTMLSPRTPIPNLLLTGQNLMLHGLEGVTMTALQTCSDFLA